MSRTVVGDFDLEANRVAFGRCAVATGQGLDGYQISIGFHDDGFVEIIAGGAWIRLVASRCSGDIGDRVATLTDINRSSQCQRCRTAGIQRSDRKQSGGRVVCSLCNRTGSKRDARGQRIC